MTRNVSRMAIGLLLVLELGCSSLHRHTARQCDWHQPGQPKVGAREPNELSIVSWNVHGTPDTEIATRLPRIAATISRHKPDIILLQEVWFEGDARGFEQELGSSYQRISEAVGVRGVVWPLLKHRNGGLLVFRATDSQWQLVSPAHFVRFRDSARWWRVWELDGLSAKGVLQLRLRHTTRAENIVVINTHLQSPYPPAHPFDKIRTKQILQLVELVKTAITNGPVIVAGDFNTTPQDGDAPLYEMMRALGDDLTETLRNVRGGGTHLDDKGREGGWIDYAFAKSSKGAHWTLAELALIPSRARDCPSDHHGLAVRVRIHSP